jgi:hypothetical protein
LFFFFSIFFRIPLSHNIFQAESQRCYSAENPKESIFFMVDSLGHRKQEDARERATFYDMLFAAAATTSSGRRAGVGGGGKVEGGRRRIKSEALTMPTSHDP